MNKSDADRELVLVRVFDAPRALVFKAWTDPKRLAQWWGPRPFTNPVCEADARPGGKWRIVMQGPDGTQHPHGGEYIEVVAPERLVMTNKLEGDFQPFGQSVWTVTFDEVDGRTTMTTRVLCATAADCETMEKFRWRDGYGSSLDVLGELLERDPARSMTITAPPNSAEMIVTRWFAAPPELVWEAVTSPKHHSQWWGPRKYTNTILEMDVRVGGKWAVEQRSAEGEFHPFHGEYLEVDPPKRLVLTQAYKDYDCMRCEMTFMPKDGGTLMTAMMRAPSAAERDGYIKAGMEWGMRESYERLDELLERLAAKAG
jgi:uncharacterized protein YndB with AHSA1/START domain